MKKIMVIAGGKWQTHLVKTASEMGLFVICSNLYPNSPAFAYAHSCEVANVLDREANLTIAQKYHPDAIITDQSDIAVTTVAYLAEKLGLPGIGLDKANLFTNKYQMRLFCKGNGFPVPDFRPCRTVQDAMEFFEQHKDIIIKPVDSQASRGVFRIRNRQQLEKYFCETLSLSNHEPLVLAEQFLSGTEFTIDGIKCDNKHYSLAISEKKHYEKYTNVASELYFSHKNPHFDYTFLKKQNDALVEKMGLPFGLTHAEYIWHDGKFYLVEIAARGGGSNISSLIVPTMSGIDHNRLLIRMALGETVPLDINTMQQPEYQDRCCVLEFFNFDPGLVNAIQGTGFLKDTPNILDYGFNFGPGDMLKGPEDDSKRPGHYIAWGENAVSLQKLRETVKKNVSIEYQECIQ